jgi:hypothetical protein
LITISVCESKTKEATAPPAAGSSRNTLSDGADAGASSGPATDPRAAVEAAVSVALADPSEGDKLNLTINIASVSATKSLSVYLAFRQGLLSKPQDW